MDGHAGEVGLLRLISEHGELSERLRLRISVDLLSTIDGDSRSIVRRSTASRLHLEGVFIAPDGRALINGEGDASGAGALIWEVLAGRVAKGSELGRIHDIVDEIHPDVDDALARALAGGYESVELFRESLEAAAGGRIASRDELRAELGSLASLPEHPSASARAGVPEAGHPIATPQGLAGEPSAGRSGIELSSASWPARPLIVVISAVETEDGELVRGLRAQGFEVALAGLARTGFEAACRLAPACVVCDTDLPDDGGDRVVLRLRRLGASIATTPMVLISSASATSARFATGADVCILKPYLPSTLILQVAALHHMSARLRDARDSLSRYPDAKRRAFQGNLDQISLSAILTVIDMERRTGVFEVRSGALKIDLTIIAGYATHGFVDGELVGPLEVTMAIVGVKNASFSFLAREGFPPVPQDAIRLGHVLAEATRLLDEEATLDKAGQRNRRTR